MFQIELHLELQAEESISDFVKKCLKKQMVPMAWLRVQPYDPVVRSIEVCKPIKLHHYQVFII